MQSVQSRLVGGAGSSECVSRATPRRRGAIGLLCLLPALRSYAIFVSGQVVIWPVVVGRRARIPRDYRANNRIRVPEVRLVDENGEQLGVMPTHQALRMAEERSVDLVEVAPTASPPVCRLMDYGRFRYETTRKEREARKVRRLKPTNELREVRMKTRIGQHDRSAKTRLVKRLLEEGSKVKVSVFFRGREIDHPQLGMELLRAVAEDLVDDAMLELAPTFQGRSLAMILAPTPTRPAKDAQSEKELDRAKT